MFAEVGKKRINTYSPDVQNFYNTSFKKSLHIAAHVYSQSRIKIAVEHSHESHTSVLKKMFDETYGSGDDDDDNSDL